MGHKLLKTVQTITTFRNPLAEPVADPSLKTAVLHDVIAQFTNSFISAIIFPPYEQYHYT